VSAAARSSALAIHLPAPRPRRSSACVALDLSAEFGILRQNEPMVVVTTVVSLVLYTLAQAPERV
jgi:hypothetical protein